MPDELKDLFVRSRAYVVSTASARDALPRATGVSERDIELIDAAGALPAATYTIFDTAIVSPIRTLGEPAALPGQAFYAPSVLHWVRRAHVLGAEKPGLLQRLESWFAGDLIAALEAQKPDAQTYGWSHLFDREGTLDARAVKDEVAKLMHEWKRGGWAVCLRRWDGHHLVTKDLERARIAALTEDAARDLSDDERYRVFDAVERLESVTLPFAPYERPHGTPGLYIDRIRARYAL